MSKTNNVIVQNPFTLRYKPNHIFDLDLDLKEGKNNLLHAMYKNQSKTDKEAFRVTLASMRSATLASNSPATSGQYAFKPGTTMDIINKYDDSYFRRPDLTLADIDLAIRELTESCKNLDEQNKIAVQNDIENAKKLRQEKVASEIKPEGSDSSE